MTSSTYFQLDKTQQTEWLLKGILTELAPPAAMEAILPQMSKEPEYWRDFLLKTGLAPIFYCHLKSAGIVENTIPAILGPIESAYRETTAKNILLQEELFRVADIFSSRGIPMTPMKGSILLLDSVYAPIGVRPMSDIDILVPRSRFSESVKLLGSEGGYRNVLGFMKGSNPPFPSGLKFIREDGRPNILELHWNIINPLGIKSRFIKRTALDALQRDIYGAMTPFVIRGHSMYRMNPLHTALSLMYHHYTHEFIDNLWFLDTILFFRAAGPEINPEALAEISYKYGMGRLAHIYLDRLRMSWPTLPEIENCYREIAARSEGALAGRKGHDILPPSVFGSSRAFISTILSLVFLRKTYFETVQLKKITYGEYFSLYAKHIARIAGTARGL